MTHAQIDPPPEIFFEEGRLFFDYVSAYISAIAGLESVANPANLMHFGPGDVVTLLGKVHPLIRIGQLSVHQQFVSGKISSPHVTNSLGGMLLNTAYEAVKPLNDQGQTGSGLALTHRMLVTNFAPAQPRQPSFSIQA